MLNKIKRYLPWIALVAAILAGSMFLTETGQRTQRSVVDPQNRVMAQQTLDRLAASGSQSVQDAALHSAIDEAAAMPGIDGAWAIAPDGEIIYAKKTPLSSGNLLQRAAGQVDVALDALPDGSLTDEQRSSILIAMAIQGGGDHNDIYRFLVRPLHNTAGALIGYLALAYDLNTTTGAGATAGQVATVLLFLLGFGIYWLALAAWTFIDARQRGERAPVWAIFVLIGNLVALIAYLLARRPESESVS